MSPHLPLISVIVPTRERAETLIFTLRSAIDQELTSYEVVVSDNFSQDNTREVVAGLGDPHIRYVRTDRRLSMCDNWEFALGHARGTYIIFIGDDDAVVPGGIERLTTLIAEKPGPAYMWTPPIYTWPIDGRKPSVAYLPPVSAVGELDLKRKARSVVRFGGWKYYELPGVYHAAVAREVLESIRGRAGRVFLSTQPDLFTSMAVPVFASRAVHTGAPVTLHGRSGKSNGSWSIAKDGAAVLARFVSECGDYRIHPSLDPELPAHANLIIDAMLVAMDAFPEFYGGLRFNYSAMWAFLYKLGHTSKRDVWRRRSAIRRHHPFNSAAFLLFALMQDGAIMRRKILNRFATRELNDPDLPTNVFDFARSFAEKNRLLPTATAPSL